MAVSKFPSGFFCEVKYDGERLMAHILKDRSVLFLSRAGKAVVAEAIARRSGARGLRAILEEIMLDIMYEVPFLAGVESCRITVAVIRGEGPPILKFKTKKTA